MKGTTQKSTTATEGTKIVELSSKLPEKQDKVIASLISHSSIKDAAEASRVSETTIWRYMQDAAFMEQYRTARRQVVEHAIVKLQHASGAAAKVLLEVAEDITAPSSARVSAARVILEQALHSIEMDDIQARVERIEAHLEAKAKEPPAPDEHDDEEEE